MPPDQKESLLVVIVMIGLMLATLGILFFIIDKIDTRLNRLEHLVPAARPTCPEGQEPVIDRTAIFGDVVIICARKGAP